MQGNSVGMPVSITVYETNKLSSLSRSRRPHCKESKLMAAALCLGCINEYLTSDSGGYF